MIIRLRFFRKKILNATIVAVSGFGLGFVPIMIHIGGLALLILSPFNP